MPLEASADCRGRDEFKNCLLAFHRPKHARHLLVGNASSGLPDLSGKVVIGSRDGRASSCPFSGHLPGDRIGLARSIENPTPERVGESMVIG